MVYKNLSIQVLLRVILLVLNALLIGFFAFTPEWMFTTLFFCMLLFLQAGILVSFINKTNTKLLSFFEHVKEKDSTLHLDTESKNSSFYELSRVLGDINKEYKEIRKEEIKKEVLLNLVLDQVNTGVIVTDEEQKIKLFNKAAATIFSVKEVLTLQTIKNNCESLFQFLLSENKEQQKVFSLTSGRQLLVSIKYLKFSDENLKIMALHNISREMNQKELESWNGLIRVLMHETMNTLTPMSTVVGTAFHCLTEEGKTKPLSNLKEKDLSDAVKSLNIINNRTESLKSFVKRYRQFVHLPKPNMEEVDIEGFLNPIIHLFKQGFDGSIILEIKDYQSLIADKSFLEQILINLIKNAVEATSNKTHPKISISCYQSKFAKHIQVEDNGCGIEKELLNKIFIPFFTTKEYGSGIGLSFSRQLMFLMGGDIKIIPLKVGIIVELAFGK